MQKTKTRDLKSQVIQFDNLIHIINDQLTIGKLDLYS